MSINAWGSDDPAEVAKGGTGNATLTDHGVLLGSGTSPVTVTAALTDGQLVIGSTGADPSLALPTGVTDEISIAGGAGTLDIGIADNPVLPGTASYTWVDGTTAQRAGTPVNGMGRYNTTTDRFEGYQDGAWTDFITQSTPGSIVQQVSSSVTSTVSCAGSVPFDNTPPTTSEGTQVTTVTLTPLSASNNLYITFSAFGHVVGAVNATPYAALYQDSGTDAIYTTLQAVAQAQSLGFTYEQVAGTASSTTFKVRCGLLTTAANWVINGDSAGNPVFGGTAAAVLSIWEIST